MATIEIITLVRNKLGLYDLKIQKPTGRTVMEAINIPLSRAVTLIESREEKAKRHE